MNIFIFFFSIVSVMISCADILYEKEEASSENVSIVGFWFACEFGFLDIEAFAAATGASYTEGYDHTGYFNNKYIPRAGESGGQTELNYLTNFRIIRYSDVLLMAAEAYNRGGIDDGLAQEFLNQVKSQL